MQLVSRAGFFEFGCRLAGSGRRELHASSSNSEIPKNMKNLRKIAKIWLFGFIGALFG